MWLNGRRLPVLPLQLPRLDGSTWPDRRALGRAGFDVSTLYEISNREAFEPPCHEIADRLLTALSPLLPLGDIAPEDAPFVNRILMVAAQVGAGIGSVESRTLAPAPSTSDRRAWGALWKALRDLPKVPAPQRRAAAFLMQAGYWVARTGDNGVLEVAAALRADLDRLR